VKYPLAVKELMAVREAELRQEQTALIADPIKREPDRHY
jgi:hypothetical protein